MDAASSPLLSNEMIPQALTSSPSSLRPSYLPAFPPILVGYNHFKKLKQRKLRAGKFRAEFSADAPVAAAIGACILSSLVFPVTPPPEDAEAESLIDSADARFAVMGIISFIPYFNWMSWVFAWLDTGNRRYAVYAIVYLTPYLRSNLSISPEDSWLPIASILLCITHIQLEASIKNGDFQGFQIFSTSSATKKNSISEERDERKDFHNLPSREHYRKGIRDWGEQEHQVPSEDEDTNGDAK